MDYDDLASDIDKLIESNRITTIATDISNTYLWVLCAFGVPGNILTIITIISMGKMTPATMFVGLLAACDGVALIVKLIYHVVMANRVVLGDSGCKLVFVTYLFPTVANWALVLIALERFFSVCYPLKKVYLFTKKRSYIIASSIFGILLLIFALIFLITREATTPKGLKCQFSEKYESFVKPWYWINASLFLFLPFTLNAILTALIIRGLVISRRDRRSIMVKDDDSRGKSQNNNRKLMKETERAERMITIMLILASTLFLILALPACIYLFAYSPSNDIIISAKWKVFKQVKFLLVDSTHALNFFLYFISAKRFRNHFISMLTCKRWPKAKSRCGASSNSNNTESSRVATTTMQ